MKKLVLMSLLLLPVAFTATAQRGKDGAKTVSTAGVIINEYTSLTADAAAGSTTIQVVSSGLNANGRFTSALAAGDLLFIIQIQGLSIDGGSWWPNFGYVNAYNNCGYNEMVEVASVPTGSSITLSCPLQHNYTASGKVQVVRVPRYTDLTVNSGGVISCEPWNGSAGGIVVMEVLGNTVVNSGGSINASALGFRGGINTEMNSATGVTIFASTNEWDGTQKGEGAAGSVLDYDLIGGRYSKAEAANGGGGGNSHNGGGGGGGNSPYLNSWNGNGNPDTSTAAWILAWDLEAPNFHKNQSDGGGRGGYTYSWNNMDATLVGPNDASWGGDLRRNEGGRGGRTLDYTQERLYLGGAGGAGDQGPDTDYGGDGGNGGGMIYLLCYGSVNGSGLLVSDGEDGEPAQGTAPWNGHAGIDGGGGGGAGGTIVVKATTIAASLNMQTNGGKGGDQIKTKSVVVAANGEAEGPGGGGGGGHITISTGSPLRTSNGGANGISYAQTVADCGVQEFQANGATKGGRGNANASCDFCYITAIGDSVCPGDTAMLIAQLQGSIPPGTMVYWFDAETGGNLLGSGDTLLVSGLMDTTTFYAGFCPGTYRVAVQVIIYNAVLNAGSDLYLCNGTSDTLHASGGTSYMWSPAGPLSNPLIADPVVSVATTTQFILSGQSIYGCLETDTMTVFVNAVNANLTADTAICNGDGITLNVSGGTDYLWSTGDTTTSVNVAPTTTQTYFVTVSSGSCADTISMTLTVNPLPIVDLGTDTSFCQGASIILDAGNAGSSFLWQDASVNQTLTVNASGTYAVSVSDANACTASDDFVLTVVDWADASITPVSPLCAGITPFALNAAQSGGVWSGNGITDVNLGVFNPSVSGTYVITYGIAGMCGDTAQTTILVHEVPVISLLMQTESCTGMNDAGISATVSGGQQPYYYLWNTGSDSAVITMLEPGNYSLTVSDSNACSAEGAALLTASDTPCYTAHIYVPNIFSPNGDGINDVFLVRGAGVIEFELIIYDRWGEKVFESKEITEGWDGSFRNKECDSGVYFYNLRFTYENGESQKTKGNVSLVR